MLTLQQLLGRAQEKALYQVVDKMQWDKFKARRIEQQQRAMRKQPVTTK